VSDGVLLAMEWASNCVFRLFECVCDVAAEGVNKASVGPAIPIPEIRTDGFFATKPPCVKYLSTQR
jgi:hypothetical protein